jgi:uncharacterized membrane protein YphA (DoxX/SURF4 family)
MGRYRNGGFRCALRTRNFEGRDSKVARVDDLQRLFSSFPDSFPGAALLVLRVLVGGIALYQGYLYVARSGPWSAGALLACLLLAVSGCCLLIGFLTPLMSLLAGLGCIASCMALLPAPAATLFDGKVVALQMVAMALVVAVLGPGAYSVDARLFGRREIVIPPVVRDPKE